MGLRHFHADGAAANDNQVPRCPGSVKQRLIGQIVHLIKTWYRRHKGRGTGGHDKAPGLDFIVASDDGFSIDKGGGSLDDLDAHGAITFH